MSYAKYALEQFHRAAAGLEVKPVFQRAYQAGTRLSTIDEAEAYVGKLLRENTTYFDIEATGKDPAARLLSLSYAEGIAGQPQTLFAKLEQPRTSLDPYIRHKILPGVEESFAATPGAQYLSERAVAEKYLEHVESRAGGALAGWNIGYHPRRLSELGKEFSEYDVPMMLEAWERHGLLERGQQALSNVHLIDIGQEFRFEIAGKLARSGIDVKSWTEAGDLIRSARPVADTYSNAVEATAKQTAGWGQAFMYESTFGAPATRAHISSADVGYLQQLTEEYVSGRFEAGFHPETYIRQMTEPGNIFLRLRAERKQFEQLHQAQPLHQRITQKDWLQLKARQTTDWIKEHPWHVGVPVAGIGVWAIQPGRLFSGRDDEYNTLEGLSHRGIAQSSRHRHTEFGSGWRGRHIIGAGAAVLGGIGLIGAATGGWKKKHGESESSSTLLTSLGISAALAGVVVAGPAAGFAMTAKRAANLTGRQTWDLFAAQVKSSGRIMGTSLKSMWDIQTDKALIGEFSKLGAARNLQGSQSHALGRFFVGPGKYIGGKIEKGVEHTADWLGKNWLPKLKEYNPAAVLLAGMSVVDAYHAGKSAYEGDVGGVVKNVALFAGMKYAYMGVFYRSQITRWAKKQKLADIVAYASSGLNALGTARNVAFEAAQYHSVYTRTGVGIKDYYKLAAQKYGENAIKAAKAAGRDFEAGTAGISDDQLKKIMADPNLSQALRSAAAMKRDVKVVGEGIANMTKERFMDQSREGKEKLLKKIIQIDEKSWLGGVAARKFESVPDEKLWELFESGRNIGFKANEAAKKIDIDNLNIDKGDLSKKLKEGRLGRLWDEVQQSNRIPGFDDPHNTLEGLRHGGIAGDARPQYGFGSGALFKVIGKMKVAQKLSVSTRRTLIENAPLLQNQLGIKIKNLTREEALSAGVPSWSGAHSVFRLPRQIGALGRTKQEGGIYLDKELFMKQGWDLTSEEVEKIWPVIKLHETSEVFNRTKLVRMNSQVSMFGTHVSPAVIADEMLAAASLGRETFNIMKKFRIQEALNNERLIERQAGALQGIESVRNLARKAESLGKFFFPKQTRSIKRSEVVKAIAKNYSDREAQILAPRKYSERVMKIAASVEKKFLPRFSGFDDQYNTIEGLRHGGAAQSSRKSLTEFGSGYDIIRSIARGMGMTYESLLNNRSFHTALQEGRVITKVGEGKFGKAYLMRSSFEGHEFSYIRKDIAQSNSSTLPESAPMMMLANTETVPTPYLSKSLGRGRGVLFMEHMPGKPLHQLNPGEAKMALESNIEGKLASTIDESTRRGIINEDIHNANIMFDPRTKRTSWIDWGLSYGTAAEMEHAIGARSMRSSAKELMDRTKTMAETGQWPARSNTSRTAESTHRRAVAESTANGKRPGRRHTSKAGRIVS